MAYRYLLFKVLKAIRFRAIGNKLFLYIIDALNTMLRLLREELEETSWLIRARSRIDPVKPYNKE